MWTDNTECKLPSVNDTVACESLHSDCVSLYLFLHCTLFIKADD